MEIMKLINLPCSAVLVLLSVVILMSPICNIYMLLSHFFDNEFKFESSVWCFKSSNDTNLCKFKNICYDSQFQAFLFFLGKQTVIKGFNNYSDLQKIQLSSLDSHNHFYANISVIDMIDIENYEIRKPIKILSKGLLLSRFKPNNIMHSVHDDLFPVFLTLESLCLGDETCMQSYILLFHDQHPEGPFYDLYRLFSKESPVLLNNLVSESGCVLCFGEVLTGLIKESLFYQYGFKKPHGPIKSSPLSHNDITRFTSFIRNKLVIKENENITEEIVLINRQNNRKITNIDEVEEMITVAMRKIKKRSTVKLIVLDLFSSNIINFIKLMSKANVLVGMHGAEMIFALFMKPKSVVFELFPFGIQPEVVSFIKPVSELEDSHLMHFPWRNNQKNNSITHPDAHPFFGGISHLDAITQEKIKNMNEVPPVECCNNPAFLYRMYQDTYVSGEFENFFLESISKYFSRKQNPGLGFGIKKWFFPYTVSNVSCKFEPNKRLLQISWHPPFNIKEVNNLKYSLYIKDQKDIFRKEMFTDRLSIQEDIPETVGTGAKFQAWIAVYDNNNARSYDLYFRCS